MGMCAADILGLELPQADKRLCTFVETDGCLVDGISVSTGCWVGRRTLKVVDFGKMAAVFVDTCTQRAIRIVPHPEARRMVKYYAPQAESDWHAYLEAYQVMPVDALLVVRPVQLTVDMQAIIGHDSQRAACDLCGEEIFNGREARQAGRTLCCACAGETYYAYSSGYDYWQVGQWQNHLVGKIGG